MMKRMFLLLPIMSCLFCSSVRANWEYGGTYVGDGYYQDDGRRMVMIMRGGVAYGQAKMKNSLGTLADNYYYDTDGTIISSGQCGTGGCGSLELIGTGNIGDLPVKEKYGEFSFTAGASLGWTLPTHQNWRLAFDWDYISESEYNVSPLFAGDMRIVGGSGDGGYLTLETGAVQSTITTNIISTVAYYDFFDGIQKPLHEMVPYIGVGIGYAASDTVLNLSDPYGDLSGLGGLGEFGEMDETGFVMRFNSSKKSSSNLAELITVGVAYGVSESFFLDFGFRMIHVPKVKWALSNSDGSRSRYLFHANSMIYTNFMFGLRFEF